MRHPIATIIFLLLGIAAHAQGPSELVLTDDGRGSVVRVKNCQAVTAADKTVLTADFVLDSLRVPANRYRAFTPIIRSADGRQQQRMKSLLVTGRTQAIVFEREGIDPLYAADCETLRRHNGQPQTVAYIDAITAQPWHQGAEVLVECDLCGCGDTLRSQLVALDNILPPPPTELPDPLDLVQLATVVPSPYKAPRNLHGSAFINFVVDRWEMKPDYMDNRRELRKITDTLNVMVADRNITVDRIKIHGWASPESPYEHNRMLATNRAQSLTDYIQSFYRLPDEVFAPAEATPENWIGLLEALDTIPTSVMPNRQAFRDASYRLAHGSTAAVGKEADRTELALKARYPKDYDYVLQNVYPHLRRSDYDITFRIRSFSLDEACRIYRLHPEQLSLRELWDVAHTFAEYSDDYNRCMQTAYHFFPDSTAAKVNLAAVALHQRDILKAEVLLNNAEPTAEVESMRAVVAIVKHDYDQAEQHLQRAEALGLDQTRNREVLRRMSEAER